MIYSFTGAQSTGKTTLLKLCMSRHAKFSYITEVTRKLKREGHVINNTADNYDKLQTLICDEHIKNITREGNYLLDRCIFDGHVYTTYMFRKGKVNKNTYQYVKDSFSRYINRYSMIFYTDPNDVKLIDDGERSTDIEFRNEIIQIYEDMNVEEYENVIKLSGTIEERYNKIKPFLEL